MSRPAIAFFGSSLVSAYWNGAATYYRGIIRALHERGYDVTFFEPDAYDRQAHRDIPDPPWARIVVYAPAAADVARALEQASRADILVKTSGVGVFDELLELEIAANHRRHALAIFWDVDAPATLDRLAADPTDPFRDAIPKYDLILTYGGGDAVVDAYRAHGAKMCVPIYNALDPATHHPVPPIAQFAADLSFLGNRLPDRERRVEEFFLQPATMLPHRRFLLAGSGWEDKPLSANVRAIGHLFTSDHNAFNVSALAVLNISRNSMARYGFSPATRVFEAAGAGACVITDAWEGIETFLEPDREVLVASNGADVVEHVNHLSNARAGTIGAAARARVLRDHTYAQRVDQLERVLSLSSAA